jgi:hypothetical protein
MTKTLAFAVYDYDRFSKHDAIGEVRLPVCQMDLAQTKEIWKELQSIVGDGKVSQKINHFSTIFDIEQFRLTVKLNNFRKFETNLRLFLPFSAIVCLTGKLISRTINLASS